MAVQRLLISGLHVNTVNTKYSQINRKPAKFRIFAEDYYYINQCLFRLFSYEIRTKRNFFHSMLQLLKLKAACMVHTLMDVALRWRTHRFPCLPYDTATILAAVSQSSNVGDKEWNQQKSQLTTENAKCHQQVQLNKPSYLDFGKQQKLS